MVGSEGICGSQDELKMKLEIFFCKCWLFGVGY